MFSILPRTFLLVTVLVTVLVCAPDARAQTFSVLYDFDYARNSDPTWFVPFGTLVQGRNGNIYTTSVLGGVNNNGTVFSMTPAGVLSAPLILTFSYNAGGADPDGGLTLGADGNLYGAVGFVYNNVACNGLGSIFKITPGGSLTYLYTYPTTGTAGAPAQAPMQGTDGNFYGATPTAPDVCGVSVNGTIYKLTPSGTLTTLIESNGPLYVLAFQGTDGNFYGFDGWNPGSVFKITPSGKYTTIYQFDGTHGSQPVGIIQGADGNFYGTTSSGGSNHDGVIFKLTPGGKITVLHNFAYTPDGWQPQSGVVQATDGNLYGVTPNGGTAGFGSIYRIGPSGTNYSILYSFDGTTAATPEIALLQHSNGLFYGLSFGGGLTCWYSQQCGTFYSL